ncbi:hypothetical protein MLGJGCBP_02196 [Rhodococcus sp. T7]|nr:hypothetical protein MLGJGCBP_02196 [Rhodococcus sp. T7]
MISCGGEHRPGVERQHPLSRSSGSAPTTVTNTLPITRSKNNEALGLLAWGFPFFHLG